jgi:FlaG/FlaF family flagellin (archaellin)
MVSEMIGEILKLAMVVTLVSVLSMSVYSLIPDERPPYLEIEMRYNATNSGTIDLTHVGGDPIRVSDVWIEVMNTSNISDKKDYKLAELTNETYWKFPQTIQLNASTHGSSNMSRAKISVIQQKAIIAVGEVQKP